MAEWWLGPTTPNQCGKNPAFRYRIGFVLIEEDILISVVHVVLYTSLGSGH